MKQGQNILKKNLERMLKEVRLLASIQDINILRYYHSWIECIEEDKKFNSLVIPEIDNEESTLNSSTTIQESDEEYINY